MRCFAFLIALSLVATLWAARQPIERYQSIINRQMFGPLPPDFDPEKMPSEVKGGGGASDKQMTQEQEKLQASVRFSGIRVSPENEVFVSFSDMADPKNPRSYYMKVGETSGGWTVLEADPVKATMTVEKDGVEVSLTIGGTSGGKDGAGAVKAAGGSAPAGRGHLNSGLIGGGSLRNRRMLRQQREAEANREAEAKRQAEAAQREVEREQERAQREAEREEQRRQLEAIQEELRKQREIKSQKDEDEAKESDGQNES